MHELAPIVLFVYNRPDHTRKTVEALQKNLLASESDLFIFADGPKIADDLKVQAVRDYIKTIIGFKSITIEESPMNKGLASSVIAGVSKVVNQYGKVIVLEDDIVTQPYFLTFMNEALELYKDSKNIMSMGGFTHFIKFPDNYKEQVFLTYRICSWGWATWQNRWELADWSMADYPVFAKNKAMQRKFNKGRGQDVSAMLAMQMQGGKIDSWAIRWGYAHFKHSQLVLYPTKSLVTNCGTDGSGVHFTGEPIEIPHSTLAIEKIVLTPKPKLNKQIVQAYHDIFGKKPVWYKQTLPYRLARKLWHLVRNFYY